MLWGDTHFYEYIFSIFHYFWWKFFIPQLSKKNSSWKNPQIKKTSHLMPQLIFQFFTKIHYFYFPFPCSYQTHPNSSNGFDKKKWWILINREKVNIPPLKSFITIEGEGAEKTVVQWGDTAQTIGPNGKPLRTFASATFAVNSPYFIAKNITFKVPYIASVSHTQINTQLSIRRNATLTSYSYAYQIGCIGGLSILGTYNSLMHPLGVSSW